MPIKRPRSPGNLVGNTANFVARDAEYSKDTHGRPLLQKKIAIPLPSAFVPKPLHPRPILPKPDQIKYQTWDRQSHLYKAASGVSSDETCSQTSTNSPSSGGQTVFPSCVIPPMTHFDHGPNKKEGQGKDKQQEKEGVAKSGRKRGMSNDEICAAMTLSTCFQSNK